MTVSEIELNLNNLECISIEVMPRPQLRLYHVYANLRNGKGMTRVTKKPLVKAKADSMADRLLRGKTHASRTEVVKV